MLTDFQLGQKSSLGGKAASYWIFKETGFVAQTISMLDLHPPLVLDFQADS